MTPEEVHDRYDRARKIAASHVLEVLFAECEPEDLLDAIEIMTLWRLASEGQPFQPMTFARMLEATNA